MNRLVVARAKTQSNILHEQDYPRIHRQSRPSRQSPSPSPRKKASPNREAVLLFVLLFCLVAISIALIAKYSSVVAVNYQIQQVEKDISQLEEKRAQLEAEAEKLGSLERIEAIALNELGLEYPEQKEWLFLSARDGSQ